MKTYRSILKAKLKDAGLTQRQIAVTMGWSSSATVSLVLSGKREFAEGELARMCELVGITIIELASQSDDLQGFSKRKGTAEGASILDNLNDEQFEAAMNLLRAIQTTAKP